MSATVPYRHRQPYDMPAKTKYLAPTSQQAVLLSELIAIGDRPSLKDRQLDLLRTASDSPGRREVAVFVAGNIDLLARKCVSIVGTREVSAEGRARASRLARELVAAGVTVVSGLAKGVDTAAMTAAIGAGGSVIGVIGTSLAKAYPAENAGLQEQVWRDHLLLSPFPEGERVYRGNFPIRNRVMAAVSDATVIIEASDTSGTLHQAAECQRLGRWLFIAKSLVDDSRLRWPASFLSGPKTRVLATSDDVLSAISP